MISAQPLNQTNKEFLGKFLNVEKSDSTRDIVCQEEMNNTVNYRCNILGCQVVVTITFVINNSFCKSKE